MKRMIRADYQIRRKESEKLMNDAAEAISELCEERGKGEFIDKVGCGPYGFTINVLLSAKDKPQLVSEIATFSFKYDPDNEDYDAEEQMHVQLDEFLDYFSYVGTGDADDYSGEDFVEDAMQEVIEDCWRKYGKDFGYEEVVEFITAQLEDKPYNLVEGEDFDIEDIFYKLKVYLFGNKE